VRDVIAGKRIWVAGKPCWNVCCSRRRGSASDLGARAVGDFERALSLAGSAHGQVFRSFATALLVIGDYARCENLVEAWFGEGHEQEFDARSDLFYMLGFARLFSGYADKGLRRF